MKLFELVATIKLDDKAFTDGVNKSTKAGKAMGERLNATSVKAVALGTALYNAGVKAAQMATSFVKSSIEAAAQVEAEKAQFNAAFGEMAGVATKALKNVQDTTGILYTRLRTVGTKAFSQLKGAGLGAADALEAMELYTNLAADAAAYYDISIEDADTRLRSFMRGNTEAGDAIGLFTSEAQRNSRAVETYGKKWNALTEAQKQMLMLNVAQEIYTQSGAIGQAARESNSWSNIIGNLGSAWTNAIAKFGAPIKEAVSPAVQAVIDKLTNEETLTKIEQIGLKLADGFTALYEGEESPLKQAKIFIGDVGTAIDAITYALGGEENAKSALKAAGELVLAFVAFSNPLTAALALIIQMIANWERVKSIVTETAKQMAMLFTGNKNVPNESDYQKYTSASAEERAQLIESGEIPEAEATLYEQYNKDPNQPDQMGAFNSFRPDGAMYGQTQQSTTPDLFNLMNIPELEGLVPGNADGLSYVPYDDYLTRLHKGEEVLTAEQARARRNGGSMDSSALYNAILQAVREGVSNIGVSMDGQRVGKIVSRHQAAQIDNDIRAGRYSYA